MTSDLRRKLKSCRFILIAVAIFCVLPLVPADAVVLTRTGTGVVQVGWPASYYASDTDREFWGSGCPVPSQVSKQGFDAWVIDVFGNGTFILNAQAAVTGKAIMNIVFYDYACSVMEGFVLYDPYFKKVTSRNWEWAVVTFNYGAQIPLTWKACNYAC